MNTESDQYFIIHLNHTGGKKIVKKADKLEDAVNLITVLNKGSQFLKNESFISFNENDGIVDGLYVVYDNKFINVYKLETLKLEGYFYNSVYRIRNAVNRYELIKGNYNDL
jgi:hypothetical protein